MSCYCDYDPPQIHRSKTVRARKEYRCCECDKKIAAGESHEYVFAVSDGYTYQPRTCSHCVGIRRFVAINIPCFCWAHGNLIEDAKEAISEAGPDDVVLLCGKGADAFQKIRGVDTPYAGDIVIARQVVRELEK